MCCILTFTYICVNFVLWCYTRPQRKREHTVLPSHQCNIRFNQAQDLQFAKCNQKMTCRNRPNFGCRAKKTNVRRWETRRKTLIGLETARLSGQRSKSHLRAGEEAILTPTAGTAIHRGRRKKRPPLAKPDLFIGSFGLRELCLIYGCSTNLWRQRHRPVEGKSIWSDVSFILKRVYTQVYNGHFTEQTSS